MGREGPERETFRMTGGQTQDPPTATNAATKCQVASAFEHSCWVRIFEDWGRFRLRETSAETPSEGFGWSKDFCHFLREQSAGLAHSPALAELGASRWMI